MNETEAANFYYDFCPACGASGQVYRQTTPHAVGTTLVPNYAQQRCGVCQGVGRIRLPNGFHLTPDAVTRVFTAAGTTIRVTAADADGEPA